jgi:hypothetical protein
MRIGLMFRTEPDASTVFAKLSYSADLTIEFLRAHPSAAWDWAAVSRNTAIPLQDKLANPLMPWVDVYNRYLDGPAPPLVEVMRHPQIDWNYEDLANSVPVAQLLASAEVLPWVLHNFSMVQWRATLNEVLQYVRFRFANSLPDPFPAFSSVGLVSTVGGSTLGGSISDGRSLGLYSGEQQGRRWTASRPPSPHSKRDIHPVRCLTVARLLARGSGNRFFELQTLVAISTVHSCKVFQQTPCLAFSLMTQSPGSTSAPILPSLGL